MNNLKISELSNKKRTTPYSIPAVRSGALRPDAVMQTIFK
jgi:hypothetical protein